MSLAGTFSSMSMADLIQWARTARRTGVITVRNKEQGAERRIFLQTGQIVACASNEPREYYGKYLVQLGYCAEDDVDRALKIQKETGVMVAAILVMVEKISRELAISTLESKTIDIICDIFLWTEGSFDYDPSPFPAGELISISVDPISIALEGMRRVDGWNELRTRIHPGAVFEPTGAPFTPSGGEGDEIAKFTLPLLDGQRDVEEVMERLPFSRYVILESIWELVKGGAARASDVTAAPSRQKRLEMNFAEAVASGQRGDWAMAVQILEGMSSVRPDFPGLEPNLAQAREWLKREIYETIRPSDVPVVAIGMEALQNLKLTPADGFIVSRIDGRLSVAEVIRISSLSELDALRSFRRLVAAKVLDFPSRRS
jgi:hypothetical protein